MGPLRKRYGADFELAVVRWESSEDRWTLSLQQSAHGQVSPFIGLL